MARIFWIDRARQRFDSLPEPDQDAINVLLGFVRQWPEMYPEMQEALRWRGYRKIVVRQRWLVLYRVKKSGSPEPDQVYIGDIVPARSAY